MMERLTGWFEGRKGAIIAFSGGVDSCAVASAAKAALGDKAIAVTSKSQTFPPSELAHAKRLAGEIGITHIIIEENELSNPHFVKNSEDRCYHCRTGLVTGLKAISDKYGISCIVDGANADDMGEHRPGMKAMKEAGVKSPLIDLGITKAEVRKIAKGFGLSAHERPAMACLASRIPYGERITKESLQRIEKAENFLRELGATQMRVRHHDSTARIEVLQEEMSTIIENRAQVVEALKGLGFAYVTLDVQGYRSGSMDEVL